MKRDNKFRIAAQAHDREVAEARDAGRDYHRGNGECLLVEVARWGALHFTSRHQQIAFLQGYIEARQQRDEYRRERR